MLEAVAGTPFQRDLTMAFTRLEKMLSPRMRQFLDRLPHVLAAKPGPRARGASSSPDCRHGCSKRRCTTASRT